MKGGGITFSVLYASVDMSSYAGADVSFALYAGADATSALDIGRDVASVLYADGEGGHIPHFMQHPHCTGAAMHLLQQRRWG